jgi:putative transposase
MLESKIKRYLVINISGQPIYNSMVMIMDLRHKNLLTHLFVQTSMIKYKAEEAGINTIVIDEAYTSKCSFLDNEDIKHHENYAGKRILRGLFRSSNGTIINADTNAAYNMIRKAIPKSFEDGIEGVVLHPRSLSIGQMITSKEVC